MMRSGLGSLPDFLVDQHLVGAGVVHPRLAGGDPHPRHDHRLDVHQVPRGSRRKPRLPNAGGRGDDHLTGIAVHRDHRPGGEGSRGREEQQREGQSEQSDASHGGLLRGEGAMVSDRGGGTGSPVFRPASPRHRPTNTPPRPSTG